MSNRSGCRVLKRSHLREDAAEAERKPPATSSQFTVISAKSAAIALSKFRAQSFFNGSGIRSARRFSGNADFPRRCRDFSLPTVQARHPPARKAFSHVPRKAPAAPGINRAPNLLPGVVADWDLDWEKTFQTSSSSFAVLRNRIQLCVLCALCGEVFGFDRHWHLQPATCSHRRR